MFVQGSQRSKMPSIGDFSTVPEHTIQTVSERTGVPPVTLRMWERRYDVVRPSRSGGNYRLYSDRDIALLRWLKHEVDSGIPVRHASAQAKAMIQSGRWPEALPALERVPASPEQTERMARTLFRKLIAGDEGGARILLEHAHQALDLDTVCLKVLTPCLVEIGEAWHRGEIRIAQEHFASSFLRGHLLNLLQTYPLRRGARRAFVGCAPSEQHEIGALMLALFLRRGGLRVDYLGANLEASDLAAYARDQAPDLVALSASTDETALAMQEIARGLSELEPPPVFGYGGRAFDLNPALRDEVAGHYLGQSPVEGAAIALELLESRAKNHR